MGFDSGLPGSRPVCLDRGPFTAAMLVLHKPLVLQARASRLRVSIENSCGRPDAEAIPSRAPTFICTPRCHPRFNRVRNLLLRHSV